jgi:two-component system KDP operon response regulator KdpE
VSDDAPLALVVEDDRPMAKFLKATLSSHGFRVVVAGTAAQAMSLFTSHNPAIVLLDLGLPDGDGLDVTRKLREFSMTPIVVLSARGREADKVEALDAGADDYVTKPFGTNELLARIRVALRHAAREKSPAEEPVVSAGPLVVDRERRLVTVDGAEVRLTPIEYKMLALLAKHAGKVVTHRQLLTEIWGPNHTEQTHYLRVHMVQLRRKLEVESARPRFVITEPGVGYRLRAD